MVPVSLCSIFIHDSVNHLAILRVIPLYQDAVNLIVCGVCDVECYRGTAQVLIVFFLTWSAGIIFNIYTVSSYCYLLLKTVF